MSRWEDCSGDTTLCPGVLAVTGHHGEGSVGRGEEMVLSMTMTLTDEGSDKYLPGVALSAATEFSQASQASLRMRRSG